MKAILTLLLALAWMPLTTHCQIESLTGLGVLRCASVDAGGAHGGSHCDDGFCCSWESGQYQSPAGQPQVAAPMGAVLPQVVAPAAEDLETNAATRVLADAPPQPPQPWQFFLRAALPVRAPSIAS